MKKNDMTKLPEEVNTAGLNKNTIRQCFDLAFEYPVVFSRDVFAADNPVLDDMLHRLEPTRRQRVVVFIDEGVADAQSGIADLVMEYFHCRSDRLELAGPAHIVRGGPAAKTGWGPVREAMWTLGSLHMDRQSFVVAVGGGSMLDMIGFATSVVHRGLRLIRIPTTTLSQDDSGVGVKNGMDEHGQKNFVGTFSPPFGVINDISFLRTLTDADWVGGVAEAIKVAAIKDADFLDFISRHAMLLPHRDGKAENAMEQIVRRSAELHLDHIRTSGDPFELGSARPLDFGHWAGHKIETMTHYGIGHGQAVAIGIALDSYYARVTKHISDREFAKIITSMTDCGLPVFHSCLLERREDGMLRVLDGLQEFREHLGGILCITLPSPLGRKLEIHVMDTRIVEDAVNYFRKEYGG